MTVQATFSELHLAVSEVDVLATLVAEWFDEQDWGGADPVVVGRVVLLLGVLGRVATIAASKLDLLETALGDARPATPGDQRDIAGNAPASASSAPSSMRSGA